MNKLEHLAAKVVVPTAALLAACSGEPAIPPTEAPLVAASDGLRIEVDAYVAHRDDAVGLPTLSWLQLRRGLPSGHGPGDIALATLRGLAEPYRLADAALKSATLREVHDAGNGPLIAHFEQQVSGLEVFRASIKIGMDRGSTPVVAAGYLAPAVQPITADFALDETAAVAAAFRAMQEGQVVVDHVDHKTAAAAAGAYAALTVAGSAGTGITLTGPARSKRLWYPTAAGLLPAYYVELSVGRSDSTDAAMRSFVISAVDGAVLFTRDLTAADSYTYRVWADDSGRYTPWDSPVGNDFSPFPKPADDGSEPTTKPSTLVTIQSAPYNHRGDPWLPAGATEADGNNVFACADIVAPDGYTPGDLKIPTSAPGTFDYTIDPTADSTAMMAPAVGTHLFYVLNFMHDYFYEVGWTESANNLQKDNYGRGGLGGDAIRAEAQDSGGTNNANASTPADGWPARIQMFLWTPSLSHTQVKAPAALMGSLDVGSADFNPAAYDLTSSIVAVDDGSGMGTSTLGCNASFANKAELTGKIALMDRGTCTFAVKTKNAQSNGAVGVILVNNRALAMGGGPFGMSGSDPTITIPTVGISQEDGARIRTSLMAGTTVTVKIQGSRKIRDGSIDTGIVAHEWGHTMSNRLINNSAGLANQQGSGMGEGWSDFVAMLTTVRAEDATAPANANWNGVYPVGAWATWIAGNHTFYEGIRRYPYSADMSRNPLTFKHIQNGTALPTTPPPAFGADGSNNAEVHSTGEVWQTMLWDCYVALLRDTARYSFEQANLRMRQYLVASLKLTPSSPTILEARDAVLAAAYATDAKDFALFWQAFARRGAGLGALGPPRTSTTNVGVTESFSTGNDLAISDLAVDDSEQSCDHDGVLDNGEHGFLSVTLRNLGTGDLTATTLQVSSSAPQVMVDSPGPVTVPTIRPYQSVVVKVKLSMRGATGITPYDLTVQATDPSLAVKRTLTRTYQGLGHFDDVPHTGTTETGEVADQAWTIENGTAVGLNNSFHWERLPGPRASYVWHCPDHDLTADHYLISPPLQVKASGSFGFTLQHRYDWEVDRSVMPPLYYDGSVIELSADGGKTWLDLGDKLVTGGYNATLVSTMSPNPLAGRQAFGGQSAGFTDMMGNPGYITTRADLGSTYAGQTVQIRLRGGMDSNSAMTGWFVKQVSFDNLANTPFGTRVADRGLCKPSSPGLVVMASSDLAQVVPGSAVRLWATARGASGPLQFTWSQVSGPAASLSSTTGASVQFTAPPVSQDSTLTFQVIASDDTQQSNPALIPIAVVVSADHPHSGPSAGCSMGAAPAASARGLVAAGLLLLSALLMRRRRWLLPLLGAVLCASACQDDYVPALPTALEDFYVRFQHDADHFPRHGGEWEQHNGDPAFYGTAFYTRAGITQQRPEYLALAGLSRDYARDVIRRAATDHDYFLSDLEEVMMAGLGLCEYAAQFPDDPATAAFLPDLEGFIDTINSITVGLGRYIDIEAGKFAIATYGPTAITAGVALLNLQYATYIKTPVAAERVAFAQELVETIETKARFGDGYRVKPGEDLLELYPNTMMMLVQARLYEQTGDVNYLRAAERVFQFIQPLRNKNRGGYNSPYSAATMGAKTDDYSTLSSQNYLTLALLILYEDTRKPLYFEEASFVLTFIHEHLYDRQQGRVLHHFIDGRIALPTDPEYFCSGCNLQLLYVLWYARHRIALAE